MTTEKETRKIGNLSRAVGSLESALAQGISSPVEIAGAVKMFELAYEQAWKALKATLSEQGHTTQGARDVFRTAWSLNILTAGTEQAWVAMIEDRNLTVHTYDEAFARSMVDRIRASHAPLLGALARSLMVRPPS